MRNIRTIITTASPTVLAVHGSASTANQWRSLAAQLGSAVTFIAPDLPGYGQAVNATDERLAALERTTRDNTSRIHLVAHSFGGAVALKLANTVPDRIASVVLYDPIAATDMWGHPGLPTELAAIWHEFRTGDDDALMGAFMTFWGGGSAWERLDANQRARLAAHAPSLRRDFCEVENGMWSLDQTCYRGPLTILRGALSPTITLGMARTIAAQHSQAVIRQMDGVGHLAPMTNPGPINAGICRALATHGLNLVTSLPNTAAYVA